MVPRGHFNTSGVCSSMQIYSARHRSRLLFRLHPLIAFKPWLIWSAVLRRRSHREAIIQFCLMIQLLPTRFEVNEQRPHTGPARTVTDFIRSCPCCRRQTSRRRTSGARDGGPPRASCAYRCAQWASAGTLYSSDESARCESLTQSRAGRICAFEFCRKKATKLRKKYRRRMTVSLAHWTKDGSCKDVRAKFWNSKCSGTKWDFNKSEW